MKEAHYKVKQEEESKVRANQTEEGQAEVFEGSPVSQPDTQTLRRAIRDPHKATPETILTLQRTYGNQAVKNLIQRARKRSPITFQRPTNIKKSLPNTFEGYLTGQIGPFFRSYCRKTFQGVEAIDFYDAYKKYQSSPSLSEALLIYKDFISEDSKSSLNLQSGGESRAVTVRKFKKKMNSPQVWEVNKATLFNEILEKALLDLHEPSMNFTSSEEYQQWQAAN
ncbi:MAG: hypothetical protein HXX20_21105 [Chloroflexi bacterium]|nr:hypothetical protein [Chloroflexota bacterium]